MKGKRLDTNATRIPELDYIRCAATLLVITFHFNLLLKEKCAENPIVGFLNFANGSMGHMGVTLFFILSGYSLFVRWNQRMQVRAYCKSRILAILPMYWIGFLTLFVYTDLLHGARNPNIPLKNLVFTLIGMDGYLYGVVPTFYKIGEWFVGCILLLYFVFPLLLKLINKYPVKTGAFTLLAFVPWVFLHPSIVPIEHSFVTRIPEFLLGMYLAKYQQQVQLSRFGYVGLLPLGVLLFIPFSMPEPFLAALLGASLFPVLYFAFHHLHSKKIYPVVFCISKYSYGIFLVHHMVLEILFRPYILQKLSFLQVAGIYILYIAIVCFVGAGLYACSKICTQYFSVWVKEKLQKNTKNKQDNAI